MLKVRAIPCLLLSNGSLVKTVQFSNPTYVGDPVNSVKIFNEMEVDEIAILDINASANNKEPDLDLLADLASECFMPLAYGGGINTIEMCRKIFSIGIEKIVINTAALENPRLIDKAAHEFGSQSIVIALDIRQKRDKSYAVTGCSGRKETKMTAIDWAREVENRGAGEIFLNSIDRDGMMNGYDLDLIQQICSSINIPVIACGGAGQLNDLKPAVVAGASAMALGSLVVYQGKNRSVLIHFPTRQELENELIP